MSLRPIRAIWNQPLQTLKVGSRHATRQNRTLATTTRRYQVLLYPTNSHRPVAQSARAPVYKPTPSHRTIFIQTEDTPNADALKFKPNNTRILPAAPSADAKQIPFLEYLTPRSTLTPPYPSPLAAQLLGVDGVSAVFYGADYITVTKDPGAVWAHIKPEVFALITETITAGTPIVTVGARNLSGSGADGATAAEDEEKDSLAYDENDDEVVGMIKELLETRIRPAIQEDGGDIDFRGFVDGQVLLKLRGACRTCDSSTVTLKTGIESMLCHYIGMICSAVL